MTSITSLVERTDLDFKISVALLYMQILVYFQEECLAESFNIFIEHCLVLIRRQREVFPTNNRQAINRLENMLKYAKMMFLPCHLRIKIWFFDIHQVMKLVDGAKNSIKCEALLVEF